MGKKLGQGSFGLVYTCTSREAQEDYAVKLVDRVNMSLIDVQHEVDMMRRLAHPCVVRLCDVYYESVFTAMVLDLCKGGDLIEGMQVHHRQKGKLPICAVQNILKMVVQSVAWLHENNVVHRDLKGDNFLMDCTAVEDPSCRIYLTDFGTATDIQPGERLHKKCGTRTYWSPELCDGDYGLPVDMWATGVLMYGLLTGKFPFQSEREIRGKYVPCPDMASKDVETFLFGLLERGEKTRLTASEAFEHPFISCVKSGADLAVEQAVHRALLETQRAEKAVAEEQAAKKALDIETVQRVLTETTVGETPTETASDLKSDIGDICAPMDD